MQNSIAVPPLSSDDEIVQHIYMHIHAGLASRKSAPAQATERQARFCISVATCQRRGATVHRTTQLRASCWPALALVLRPVLELACAPARRHREVGRHWESVQGAKESQPSRRAEQVLVPAYHARSFTPQLTSSTGWCDTGCSSTALSRTRCYKWNLHLVASLPAKLLFLQQLSPGRLPWQALQAPQLPLCQPSSQTAAASASWTAVCLLPQLLTLGISSDDSEA